MTLTVVVGSSGSGKTTFLNDVHKSHKCIYIRQYHNIRPYVTVAAIPNFDPAGLPFWDIYEKEGKAETIQVGGTMAGEFTAGLSGGQRKLLLFELIYQRTQNQSDLLIVLDEPFAGVTDDFVPFITERLNEMREKHNILLVTNDHVETLKSMGDNTITVSAVDRTKVQVNGKAQVDRSKVILALALGDAYQYNASWDDFKFFLDVEVKSNSALVGVAIFTTVVFALFLATFWDSSEDSTALVIVAASILAYFCLNPYLLALVDWRNYMSEEAEALLHASKTMNKAMKSTLTLVLLVVISLIEFGVVNAVVDGQNEVKYWIAMLFDSASMTFSFICFGLYTKLPFTTVQIVASMPFMLMIFFSTTFSPGSGVEGFKELRYLFARFYWWCMLPDVGSDMENCPDTHEANMLYLILSGIIGLVLFLFVMAVGKLVRSARSKKTDKKKNNLKDDEFRDLQVELYGEHARDIQSTTHSQNSNTNRV